MTFLVPAHSVCTDSLIDELSICKLSLTYKSLILAELLRSNVWHYRPSQLGAFGKCGSFAVTPTGADARTCGVNRALTL